MTMKFIDKNNAAVNYFGCSPRTLDRWISAGRVPKPIHLSARIVGWFPSTLEAWRREREEGAK